MTGFKIGRPRAPVAALLAAGGMLAFSGCATKEWVQEYVKETNDPIVARVAQGEQRDAKLAADTAAATASVRSVAEQGVRKSDAVDQRVSQAILDINKVSLVETTVLHYRPNGYALDGKQKAVLDGLNEKLSSNPGYMAHIVGKTDAPGSVALNDELSWRRATEVQRYLASKKNGAVFNRVVADGEGKEEATSKRANAEHRKVTIAIYKPAVQ